MLDVVEDVVGRELRDVGGDLDGLIDRDGADRHRRGRDDRLANRIDVSAGRQIHHGVGAVVHRMVELLELAIDVGLHRRVTDVGVDLDAGDLADRHRVKPLLQMIDVGRDYQPADRDFVPNRLGRKPFPLGDALDLGSNGALTGEEHLGAAGHAELPSPVRTGSGSKGVISAHHRGGHPCQCNGM